MISLALSFSLVTTAASPEALVALTRRSGVAAPRAQQAGKELADLLRATGVPARVTVDDATSCKAKKVCLVDFARRLGASVLVAVEIGSALDEGSLRVEALSIDEDGKRLGLVEVDGPVDALLEKARPALEGEFARALRGALGTTAPEPPPPAPPVVEAPAPKPAPLADAAPPPPSVEAVEAQPPEPLKPSQVLGLITAGAGAATLAVSGVLGVQALSGSSYASSLCPAGAQCHEPAAFSAWTSARDAQTAGVVLAGVGGALLAAGAVLFFVAPGGEAEASAVVVPLVGGGAMASVAVRY